MRIVAVADTHLFEADLASIPDGDVFVHAGDMCRGGTLEELTQAAAWIRRQPHEIKIVVAGNHDWAFVREASMARRLLTDEVIYLEDSGTTINGLKIWGSPWQPAFGGWAFNLQRGEEIREKWSLIPDDTQILITHGPPAGYGDNVDDVRRAGCEDLRAAVERIRPLLHMYGHIHQDGGVWQEDGICYANVTTWECERAPTVLDVTAEGVVPVRVPARVGRAWRG